MEDGDLRSPPQGFGRMRPLAHSISRSSVFTLGMIEGLQNKTVIVTGGAHGIGKAYCLAFGKAGSRVVIADLDKRAADEVAAEMTKTHGPQALSCRTDVSDEASTKAMAALTFERFGRIDVLINNAAIFATIPM